MASSISLTNADDNNNINRTLLLTEIPADENTTVNLCNHFCKFGKILWIEVPFDDNPKAATVTFEKREHANAALNSAEPLLNNRLIKMSWNSSPDQTATAVASTSTAQGNDKKCTLCDKVFASQWHRDNHVKRIHSGTGFKCDACNATFTSANLYKKHSNSIKPSPIKPNPSSMAQPNTSQLNVKPEHVMPTFDYAMAEKNVLLRLRMKSMKKIMKNQNKGNSKALKLMEKKKNRIEGQLQEKEEVLKQKEDLLKEKDEALTSLQQNNATLEGQNAELKQTLQNERQTVLMLRDTLALVVNVNHSRLRPNSE